MSRAARPFPLLILPVFAALLGAACSPTRPTVAELTLRSDPGTFPASGGQVVLTATVVTTGGAPIPNTEVTFTTSGGTLSESVAGTDGEGNARVTLTSSEPVTVRAQVEDKQAELAIRPNTQISISFQPEQPSRNQFVTVRVSIQSGGQSGSGQVRLSFGDGESADLGQVNGEAATTHRWTSEGSFEVTATLREGSFESSTSRRVEVSGLGPLDDHIDASQVTWLFPATTNVSDWRVTSEVRGISINGTTVCVDHSKAGQWPLVSIDSNPPNIEANILVVVNIDGRWYGSGFDWLGGGRICKTSEPSEWGRDQIRISPLDGSWRGPRSGETVGFLITTPSSGRIPVRSVNERTPIILVTWP